MNDISKTIGWADYSFNPITGCKRGCEYCYARRIHERFNPGFPFSHIMFHPDRMDDLLWLGKRKNPLKIFVGSMSDIEYWPEDVTKKILREIAYYPRHTFMFLSKNPMSYHGFLWPINAMQGLTMTLTQTEHCQAENIEQMTRYPRPYLSLEPLLGTLKTVIPNKFETVIVGAMTGPGAVRPLPEWIESVKTNAPADKIHWKNNIKKYL